MDNGFDIDMAMGMLRTAGLLLGWTAVVTAVVVAVEAALGRR